MKLIEVKRGKTKKAQDELSLQWTCPNSSKETKPATNKTIGASLIYNSLPANTYIVQNREVRNVVSSYLSTLPDSCVRAIYSYGFTTAPVKQTVR